MVPESKFEQKKENQIFLDIKPTIYFTLKK